MKASITLEIWTVYNHPSDYPDKWVARRWVIDRGQIQATEDAILSDSLMTIRDEMQRRHLTYLPRYRDDDPNIFECWI